MKNRIHTASRWPIESPEAGAQRAQDNIEFALIIGRIVAGLPISANVVPLDAGLTRLVLASRKHLNLLRNDL